MKRECCLCIMANMSGDSITESADPLQIKSKIILHSLE